LPGADFQMPASIVPVSTRNSPRNWRLFFQSTGVTSNILFGIPQNNSIP
jgi:hypothetical protein